jgi:hypothetical protein
LARRALNLGTCLCRSYPILSQTHRCTLSSPSVKPSTWLLSSKYHDTSVPQNWSLMVVALQNFSWMEANSFRVFTLGAIYRRKGDVRWHPGGPHHTMARLGGAPPYGVAASVPSSVSALDSIFVSGKIGGLAFVSSNSENIFCTTFLKYKTTENRN